MEQESEIPLQPKFRAEVSATVQRNAVEIALGESQCSFEFADSERQAVVRLFEQLEAGGATVVDLATLAP